MNTIVTFENAKLLKEKGFDEPCYRTYPSHDKKISPFPLLENMGGEPILNPLDYKWKNSLIHESVISAPTISEVVMWFYEKHGIWIYVKHGFGWEYFVEKADNSDTLFYNDGTFNSPTEAYQEAIKHTLENLI